jgi:hypothetical protein
MRLLGIVRVVGRNPVAFLSSAWEIALLRHLHQREPILRRVVLRSRLLVGRRHSFEVDDFARGRFRLRGVDEAVAADPHVVLTIGQIGYDKASPIIGDHALDEARRQISRFGDHPNASLWSPRAGDDATDIVSVNGDWRATRGLLASGHHDERRQEHPREAKSYCSPTKSLRRHTSSFAGKPSP